MWGYEDISLELFISIAETGDVKKLCRSGKVSGAGLAKRWEEIIKKNADVNQDSSYDLYLDNLKAYGYYMHQYIIVKAMLSRLCYMVDTNHINELNDLGYKIKTTKVVDGKEVGSSQEYQDSLTAAMRRSENLITKINSKYKEMKLATEGVKADAPTLGAMLAQISFGVGFSVPVTVTLCQFNEYKKIVKQKYDEQRNKQAGRSNG